MCARCVAAAAVVAEKAIRFRLNCPHGLCRLISSRLFAAAAASYRYTACDMTKNQLGIIVQSRTKLMHIVWQCTTVKGFTWIKGSQQCKSFWIPEQCPSIAETQLSILHEKGEIEWKDVKTRLNMLFTPKLVPKATWSNSAKKSFNNANAKQC